MCGLLSTVSVSPFTVIVINNMANNRRILNLYCEEIMVISQPSIVLINDWVPEKDMVSFFCVFI